MADDPKPRTLRILTGEEFARLPAGHRALYNHLRRQHGMVPIEEPAIDLSPKPYVQPPKLFDNVSPLARAIVGGGDLDGQLWQKLLVEMEAALAAGDGTKRPAHRPKQETRKIAEHASTRLLTVWDRLPSEKRVPQRTVLRWLKDGYGISRNEVFKLLKEVRKHAQRRRPATD
jgi:hypothetical protein